MGLFQKAVETYENNTDFSNAYSAAQKSPMAPVYHDVKKADLEIVLDREGNFVSAGKVPTDDSETIIPVTEKSAGRTSRAAADRPHPLCDKLSYFLGDAKAYINQLEEWADSEYSHEKIEAVLKYVQSGTVEDDLVSCNLIKTKGRPAESDSKMFVRWRVNGTSVESACWKDPTLFEAYIKYYRSQTEGLYKSLCMISGEESTISENHMKGIVRSHSNAKLISANDDVGYTYRGRFTDSRQAASIGLESSQKAHNALKWLAANQGRTFGGRTFICWNPEGVEVCVPTGPFMNFGGTTVKKPSDYSEWLKNTLEGHKNRLPANAGVIIVALDAASDGRLAITYYNELLGSDYLERLHRWEEHCCWYNGKFGIQSPLLEIIARCAYGREKESKNNTDGAKYDIEDKIMRREMQMLVECRVDGARIPLNLEKALMVQASAPEKHLSDHMWRRSVFIACALLNKYLYDTKGVNVLSWKLDTKDRSFQFGRLLAAMEKVEEDYYWKTRDESEKKESRQTNAIRSLSIFRQRPYSTYVRINTHLESAYVPRVDAWQRDRYERLKIEITAILSEFPKGELNRPLNDVFLMGYDLQRMDFYKSKKNESGGEVDE